MMRNRPDDINLFFEHVEILVIENEPISSMFQQSSALLNDVLIARKSACIKTNSQVESE